MLETEEPLVVRCIKATETQWVVAVVSTHLTLIDGRYYEEVGAFLRQLNGEWEFCYKNNKSDWPGWVIEDLGRLFEGFADHSMEILYQFM